MPFSDRVTAVGLELVNLLLGYQLRVYCEFLAIKEGQTRTSKPFSDNTEGLAYIFGSPYRTLLEPGSVA